MSFHPKKNPKPISHKKKKFNVKKFLHLIETIYISFHSIFLSKILGKITFTPQYINKTI